MTDERSPFQRAVDEHLPENVDPARLLLGARSRARVARRPRASVLAAAATVVLAAVGVGQWSMTGSVVPVALGGPGRIVEIPCPDGVGFCAPTYEFDGVRYDGPGCAGVRADVVSARVLARGKIGGRRTEVRAIEGVDPALLVAIRRPAGGCGEEGVVTSSWSLAPAKDEDARDAVRLRELHVAVCAVVVPQERTRNRCSAVDPTRASGGDARAPIAAFDARDWDWRMPLSDLECERGTVGFRVVPPGPVDGDATPEAALRRLDSAVLDALSFGAAARTSTVAFRQIRESDGLVEELFFRGDVWPVAYGTVRRTTSGRWVQGGYVGCVPESAVPRSAELRQR